MNDVHVEGLSVTTQFIYTIFNVHPQTFKHTYMHILIKHCITIMNILQVIPCKSIFYQDKDLIRKSKNIFLNHYGLDVCLFHCVP